MIAKMEDEAVFGRNESILQNKSFCTFMMKATDKIYIAGPAGLVGSALVRA